jgi:hypothetical protein
MPSRGMSRGVASASRHWRELARMSTRVARVGVDLLVLLEPAVHGVPVQPDEVAELGDRGVGIPQRRVHGLLAGLDGEVLCLAAAGGVGDGGGRDEQVGPRVGLQDVVGGVVGDLLDQARPGGVGHHLAPQVGPHALGALLRARTRPARPVASVVAVRTLSFCAWCLADPTCRRRRGRSPSDQGRTDSLLASVGGRSLPARAREPAGHITVRRALVRSAVRPTSARRRGALVPPGCGRPADGRGGRRPRPTRP